jgi:hypothetical protein
MTTRIDGASNDPYAGYDPSENTTFAPPPSSAPIEFRSDGVDASASDAPTTNANPNDGADKDEGIVDKFKNVYQDVKKTYDEYKTKIDVLVSIVKVGKDVVTGDIPGLIKDVPELVKNAQTDAGPDGQAPGHDKQEIANKVDGSLDYNKITEEDQELIDGAHPAPNTYQKPERYT